VYAANFCPFGDRRAHGIKTIIDLVGMSVFALFDRFDDVELSVSLKPNMDGFCIILIATSRVRSEIRVLHAVSVGQGIVMGMNVL
jgi:hypothetical protein